MVPENKIRSGETERNSSDRPDSWKFHGLSKRDCAIALGSGLLFFFIHLLWFRYDHHIRSMDEAGHIICGLAYKDLLLRGSILKANWWSEFLTINRFYPPTVYIETGLLKAIFGASRIIDHVVASGSALFLTASLFLSVRMLGFGIVAAGASAVLVNLYPEVPFLTHLTMLDMPAMAAISLGIFALLLWWQKQSYKAAIYCGLLVGICCLTKQIVTAFLLGTGLFLVALALMDRGRESRGLLLRQLVVLVFSTILVGLPWVLANIGEMNTINEYMCEDLDRTGTRLSPMATCLYYLKSYWPNLSPLLSVLFLLSLPLAGLRGLKALMPMAIGIGLGFLMMCMYIYPFDRYVVATFILLAAITGVGLERLWRSGNMILRSTVVLSLVAAALQYASFNFCPYPLSGIPVLSKLSDNLGVNIVTGFYDRAGNKYNPAPHVPWGYDWALKTIEKHDSDIIVYLNVLMNEPNLNAQTFSMEAKERGLPVIATTSLLWTVVGDEVDFKPDKALYYHWYLVKEEGMKRKFKDEQSKRNYKELLRFLKESGKYRHVDSMTTPEGSVLSLYRVRSES